MAALAYQFPPNPFAATVPDEANQVFFLVSVERVDRTVQAPLRVLVALRRKRVIDCTASSIFQMKLERDWRRFSVATAPLISIRIDAEAKRCIGVSVPRASTGGVWDAFLQLQHRLCVADTNGAVVDAFYGERAGDRLFQPEPGCSEPTFVGSTADVMVLAAAALNVLVGRQSSVVPRSQHPLAETPSRVG